jgi:acetyltransferase-like isoleucine patch superfamily enzyme
MRVRVGAHCNIGSHVIIMDNDFHRLEPERRNEMPESAPVILEDNAWIGCAQSSFEASRLAPAA